MARLAEGGGTETLALYSLRKYRHLKVSFTAHRVHSARAHRSSRHPSGCTPRRIPRRLNRSNNPIQVDNPPCPVLYFYPTY